MNTTLTIGDSGEAVKQLQRVLAAQGFFKGGIGGNFQQITEKAVVAFQLSHIDEDGKPLVADGKVGPKTWWALANPSGNAQRSGIVSEIPGGGRLTIPRLATLKVAREKHRAGTREIPDGSNKGDGVDEIIAGFGPAPWCALFVSFCVREATGFYPMGRRWAHCATFWNAAKKAGRAHAVGSGYIPKPGDAFVFVHPNGTGHTGFVLAVDKPRPDSDFNTIEGNCGNRVKCGLRSPSERHFAGFVDLFGDADRVVHDYGLLSKAARVGGEGTR
jgi:peptidoglycan hydrolase-like protein with peptidoglycan-binding domain